MSSADGKRFWQRRKGLTLGATAVAVGVLVGAIALVGAGGGAADTSGVPTYQVATGPLTISVIESGTITSRDQVVIKSQVEGRPTIIQLVDEGVWVNPGDLLIELDSSGLQTDLVNQEIKVQNAESAMIQAQEAMAVAENQARSDVAQAELDYELAKLDLEKYEQGEYPNLLKEAQNTITLAEEELRQAEQTSEWSQKLFAEKYISQNELEKDRLAERRTRLEYELAVEELRLLKEFTYKRQMAELSSAVDQMAMALERTRRSATADVIKAQADLRAKEAEFRREQEKRDKLVDQIAKCKMTAPVAGMVVYATTGKASWRGNQEPLQEGQEVRERQELIYLPTANAMQAEVKIHESSLDKIAVGMPVRLNIDALPGRTYRGKVSKISPLPDGQSIWMNPDLKVYATTIELEGELKDVRTGMTCRAEILVDHYAEATYVPVQSVVRLGNQPTVYVRTAGGFEPRPVDLGLSNNRMVRIVGGLNPGEVVSLTPPLAPAAVESTEIAGVEPDAGPAAPKDPAPAPAAPAAEPVAAAVGAVASPQAQPVPSAGADADERAKRRERLQDVTPEERQKLRERYRPGGGEGAGS